MRLLLDTHVVLWFAAGNPALSAGARSQVVDPQNEIWVSHATVWEMAIKTSLGKLKLDRELGRWLERYVVNNGFAYLPLSLAHTLGVARLPHHHGDPFDRGMSDSYYGRIRGPHRGGVGGDSGLRDIDLTQQEIADYMAGYDYNESTGDKKDWG